MNGLGWYNECIFCSIVAGDAVASIVYQDERTLAFMDPRQFHPGHVLVIPRQHMPDFRSLRAHDAGPLMTLVVAAARAVDTAFPSDGLSIRHSAGTARTKRSPTCTFTCTRASSATCYVCIPPHPTSPIAA